MPTKYLTYVVPDTKRSKFKTFHKIPISSITKHVPTGQECWCKPFLESQWDRPAYKRREVIIIHSDAKTKEYIEARQHEK